MVVRIIAVFLLAVVMWFGAIFLELATTTTTNPVVLIVGVIAWMIAEAGLVALIFYAAVRVEDFRRRPRPLAGPANRPRLPR